MSSWYHVLHCAVTGIQVPLQNMRCLRTHPPNLHDVLGISKGHSKEERKVEIKEEEIEEKDLREEERILRGTNPK